MRVPRNYPVSTKGLTPLNRCIDLRQRAMTWARRRPPLPRLAEQMIDNLAAALGTRTFSVSAAWQGDTFDGDICVFSMGGGYHRYCRARQYDLHAGHVVRIGRDS